MDTASVKQHGAASAFLDAASADDWHSPARRRHEGIPSLAVSNVNGRMWATWYTSPTGAEDANNYLVLSTSTDDGATWRRVRVETEAKQTFRIDLRAEAPQAKYVRVGRVEGKKDEVFHLNKILVYGTKLY